MSQTNITNYRFSNDHKIERTEDQATRIITWTHFRSNKQTIPLFSTLPTGPYNKVLTAAVNVDDVFT